MEADELENLNDFEVQHITESDKIKLRLKNFCYVIGLLFILWVISIIIVISTNINKEESTQDNSISKDETYIKAEKFISNLTFTDIINLLNGKNNINNINKNEEGNLCEGQIDSFNSSIYPNEVIFKGMCIQDGTTGVFFSNGTGILWQSEINTAATFNKTLMYEIGKAQGAESKEKGINTLLSPSVNIMKRPKDGILWESFGDDPFYSGVCASKIIKGIQESGVIATIKHFLGNDREEDNISNLSNIDINALMDIYVEPFYRAIHEEDVRAVMVGNNILNNVYCYENEYLLTNILRNNLSFKGFIISDLWDIYNNHNYNCSLLDLNMQEECILGPPNEVYKNDTFKRNDSFRNSSEEYMDNQTDINERFKESAKRIIAAMYKMNQMEDYPKVNLSNKANSTETSKRKNLQKKAATESQVLLKNDKILPLKEGQKIAVIGNIALEGDYLIKDKMNLKKNENFKFIYDAQNTIFGSFKSPLPEIKAVGNKKKIIVNSLINLIYKKPTIFPFDIDLNEIKKSVKKLKQKEGLDVVIVFITANSYGNYFAVENNIVNFILWNGNELINKIKDVIKVIVVINAPSFDNLPWLNEVKAVLFSGFPGEGSCQAIADILIGEVNPSGHLPFTWAEYKKLNFTKLDKKSGKTLNDKYRYDRVDNKGLKDNIENYDMEKYYYPEGLYIGQRWFNKYNKTNKYIFPFGFGLSYTIFNYTDLNLSISEKGLIAEFNVTNTGYYQGQAVPMMFLNFPDSIGDYPKYIFKGFIKVNLEPNETQRVNISVDDHALSYFKDNKYDRVNKGIIGVYIAENGNISDSKLFYDIIDANYKKG